MAGQTPPFPEAFRRIELVLAREPGRPTGDAEHRFTLIAPLTPEGRLDAEVWRANKERCRVVRVRGAEAHKVGRLIHAAGDKWAVRYEEDGDMDAGYRLGEERFIQGEYVSIEEDDGMHTFWVSSVRPL